MITQQKKRIKRLTRASSSPQRTLESSLMNKEEVFRMLCLSEVTGLPLLLLGTKGVAKTKSVFEYAKAWLMESVDPNDSLAMQKANEEFMNKFFILEANEGTKSSDVRGYLDLEALLQRNSYEMISPIADASVIILNEIDKCPGSLRNLFLSIMNEKMLLCGKIKKRCKWKLFIATCNKISNDEDEAPFWDRFILKMNVNRLTSGELVKYFEKGGKNYREHYSINLPTQAELDAITVPIHKLSHFIQVTYNESSDRTLTFTEELVKAVSFIWNASVDAALIKTSSIIAGDKAAAKLKEKLLSNAMKKVNAKVEMLHTTNKQSDIDTIVNDIGEMVKNFASNGELSQEDINEIQSSMSLILDEKATQAANSIAQVAIA